MIEVIIKTDRKDIDGSPDPLPRLYCRLPEKGESVFSSKGVEFVVKSISWISDPNILKQGYSVPMMTVESIPKKASKVLNG